LVVPVVGYGMDVFSHPDAFLEAFRSKERKWWRKLLRVGGRSPKAAVQVLIGESGCDVTWRVERATLLLKFANAPAGSSHHLALIAHHHLRTARFTDAVADVCLASPNVRFVPTMVDTDPFLSSTGYWSDEGAWMSSMLLVFLQISQAKDFGYIRVAIRR